MVVLRLIKACKAVPGWKHFSCQNVKAGDVFGINLFLCLSLTLSVAVRNGFDAVQICPISSVSCSQLSDGASQSSALFPACQSDFSSQCIYLCLLQHQCPAWHQQPTSEDQCPNVALLSRCIAQWQNACLACQGSWDPDYRVCVCSFDLQSGQSLRLWKVTFLQ